jgi:hypothetical protein
MKAWLTRDQFFFHPSSFILHPFHRCPDNILERPAPARVLLAADVYSGAIPAAALGDNR